ncbi:MAG: AAA family ATPase [Acidobacteriaceae bacterium]
MKLIFLYGLPATGKHTIAQHLAALTGYKLFHNHLAVDLLLSVFDFGTPPFVELREQIWLSVFEQAAATNLPGLIFTFAPERTVRPTFIPAALALLARYQATVDFIELTCPLPELKQRLANPSRQRFQKLTSVELFDQLHAGGVFDSTHMPAPRLTIDTSRQTPEAAAALIAQSLKPAPIA